MHSNKNISIYHVKTIKTIDQINECPVFEISHYRWTKNYRPKAMGKMALLDGYGLIVMMTATETDPLRQYHVDDSPVYKDSGLEAFINFAPENLDKGYFNFEMNANGAMLSEFGTGKERKKLKEITAYHAECTADIVDKISWSVLLKIPKELICEIYGKKCLSSGDIFTCNFYKISEDPRIEHYASYAPVESPTPNFHLPNCFARAIID